MIFDQAVSDKHGLTFHKSGIGNVYNQDESGIAVVPMHQHPGDSNMMLTSNRDTH